MERGGVGQRGRPVRAWQLGLLLEWLRHPQAFLPAPPALVQEHREVHTPLSLERPCWAARGDGGFTLIPWDRYMEEAEEVLRSL